MGLCFVYFRNAESVLNAEGDSLSRPLRKTFVTVVL